MFDEEYIRIMQKFAERIEKLNVQIGKGVSWLTLVLVL